MYLARIENYPTGLSTATLNINFERSDGTFYYNDSTDELLDAGLYQITDNGQGISLYDQIPTRSVLHRDGVGAPVVAPHRAGLVYIDDLGRQWDSAGQVIKVLTPPTGTTQVMPLTELGAQYVPDPNGYGDLQTRGGTGAWYAERYVNNFVQIRGPNLSDIVLVGTFVDTFTWLIDNVAGYDVADFHFLRDETTFLCACAEQAALNELQFVLGGHPFPDLATHQYIYTNPHETGAGTSRFRRVTTFAPGQVQRSDDFHWVGPVATLADVTAAIAGFVPSPAPFAWPHDTVTETLNVTAANTQYATTYDTAIATDGNIHVMVRGPNGRVAAQMLPATWITDLDAVEDGNGGTLGTETVGFALVNRRIYLGQNAAGILTVGVNNGDVAGEMLLVITTIPVTE